MKILVVNTSPAFNDGITNVIINLQNAVNTDIYNMDLVVVAKPSDTFVRKMNERGCEVYFIERSISHIFGYLNKISTLIKNNKYDIVHIHGNSHTTVLELFAAAISGCRNRFVHAHNTFCKEKAIHFLATPIFDFLCTKRLACGVDAGKFMHGEHKFFVVNNGVNTERFRFNKINRKTLRAKLGLEENIIIGHVGTLYNEQKNQMFLLDLISVLVKHNPTIHLCLVGEGEDKDKFIQRIAELGIKDFVTFIGAVDDVAPFLSAFDIIVMPSNYEGLPLSLIEEQANGLFCFVSDVITREVDKTGNVDFCSLDEGLEKWALRILEYTSQEDRSVVSQEAIRNITECGYNIMEESKKLEKLYKESKRRKQ